MNSRPISKSSILLRSDMFTPNSDAMRDHPVSVATANLDALQQPPVMANPPTHDVPWQPELFTNNLDTPGSSDALSSSFSYMSGFEYPSVPYPVTDISSDQQWNHHPASSHLSSQPSLRSTSTRRRSSPATSGPFIGVRQLTSGSTRRASVIEQSLHLPAALYNTEVSPTQGQVQYPPIEWGLSRTDDPRSAPDPTYSMDCYDTLSLPTPPVDMLLPTDGHNLPPTSQHAQNFPGVPDPVVALQYASVVRPSSLLASENPRHQSGTQGDFAGMTYPTGEVPCAQPGHVATEEQGSNKLEESLQHDLTRKRKERDKAKKRRERLDNSQVYAEICRLLKIPLRPKNTLPERSEQFYIYPVSDIEQFTVLGGVNALLAQRQMDRVFQHYLEENEDVVGELVRQLH